MGTRADFYVGRGKDAEWLGSIAMDGYPDKPGHPQSLLGVKNEEDFRTRVEEILHLDHATRPNQGWPWPWETSCTTDYAYAYDDDLFVSCFGSVWVNARALTAGESPEFPNMKDIQNVTLGERSGAVVVGV